ncbi:MAG: hypothetical protein H7X95_03310, partial [Deltaproteobacteria bacterium]|nr:hypothetical protein [Deltaproteobacteria bacterium]
MIVVWIVAILTLIPGLAFAAKPVKPADEQPQALRMTISATTERIPLPPGRAPIQLSVDALARRLRLTPSKDGGSLTVLFASVARHAGFLCPKVAVKDGAVELTCRTARIEAQITPARNGSYLDINELRGLPWRAGADAPPAYFYDPWRMGMAQMCPGKAPA